MRFLLGSLLILLAIAADAAPTDPLETGRKATAYVIAQGPKGTATGTGFCVDTAGIFVTNDHVVTENGKVVPKITLIIAPGTPEERKVAATVLKTDATLDVAILKVDRPGLLHTVDLEPPVAVSSLRETAPVMAMGFPRGQLLAVGAKPPEVSVSTGKVTAIRKSKDGEAVAIQFDGSINPGNSGGPLLNENGKVIGIVYAILLDARQLNLAKPVSFIWYMLGQANVILTPKLLEDPAAGEKLIALLATGPATDRAAVPEPPQVAASVKLVREVFAAKYADKSPKGRQQLIADLLEEAEKSKDDPGGKYAMVNEARDLSLVSGDLPSAFYATAMIADNYKVDALELMSELVQKLAMRATKPQEGALATAVGIVVLEARARRDEYAEVRKLMPLVRSSLAASRNISVANSVRDRLARLDAEAAESEKAKPVIEKLKSTPDDPASNLIVGRYYCFVRGDFDTGLPLLLKSGDAAMQLLAKTEAEKPDTVEKRKALADLWWDQITKEQKNPAAYERCRQRAAMWYRLAEPDLKGLEKQAVAMRLETLPGAPGSRKTAATPREDPPRASGSSRTATVTVDLLQKVDPAKDTVAGKFEMQNGELVSTSGGQQRIEFQYAPPREYDFLIEFTISKAGAGAIQILTWEKKPFIWVMQPTSTFHYLKGGSDFRNKTTTKLDEPIQPNVRYTSVVRVRNTGATAYINDKQVAEWKTDFSDIDPSRPFWHLRNKSHLGVGITSGNIVIHAARVVSADPGK